MILCTIGRHIYIAYGCKKKYQEGRQLLFYDYIVKYLESMASMSEFNTVFNAGNKIRTKIY